MNRSGYSEGNSDCDWDWIRWRGAVASALRGKRGQSFLNELLSVLDNMPKKRLIDKELQNSEGEVCAVASIMKARGISTDIPVDDYDAIADLVGVNAKLVQELEWINDTASEYIAWPYTSRGPFNWYEDKSPERRWALVRQWVEQKLIINQEATEVTQ